MTASRIPQPAFPARDSATLYGDKALYARIAVTGKKEGARVVVEKFEIPIRNGKAWVVKKGTWTHRLRLQYKSF